MAAARTSIIDSGVVPTSTMVGRAVIWAEAIVLSLALWRAIVLVVLQTAG